MILSTLSFVSQNTLYIYINNRTKRIKDVTYFYMRICHPELNSLNARNKLISTCPHRKKHLLCNQWTNDSQLCNIATLPCKFLLNDVIRVIISSSLGFLHHTRLSPDDCGRHGLPYETNIYTHSSFVIVVKRGCTYRRNKGFYFRYTANSKKVVLQKP